MTRSPLAASPVVRAVERWLPLIVVALAATLILSDLNQGWVPHDEGVLGQSAERILAGQVPHRDFDELYTGALAYLHAGAFAIGSIAATTLRIPLFVFALLWVAAFHSVARRFVPPAGAALLTITAVVWSIPNYPASMPSWFNLFFATFGTLALLRWLETGRRHWLLLAGASGGVSFLFKLSGVFYLFGGGMALIGVSARQRPDAAAAARSGAVMVFVLLAAGIGVIGTPIARAGASEVARFLVPLIVIAGAVTWREWRDGGARAGARLAELFNTVGPFALGAAIPILAYSIFLLANDALAQTIDGVLVKPFRRLEHGSMHPPEPSALVYSLGIGLLMLAARQMSGRASAILAIVAAVVFGAVIYASGDRPGIYGMGVLSAWGLPILVALGAAWLIITRSGPKSAPLSERTVVLAAIACSTLLVEFPFAAPIYLFFTIPLTMLALAAIVRSAGGVPASVQLVVIGFLLVFALVRVNPGSVEAFGSRFAPTDETARLKLERGGLRVRAADAAQYEALIGVVQSLASGRTLWAGPDAPEVYFLSGMPNQTRTMLDLFDTTTVPLIARVRAANASLVVLNLRPDFSRPPDPSAIQVLRAEFPHARTVPGFLVLWR